MEPVNIRHVPDEVQNIGHMITNYGTLTLQDDYTIQIVQNLSQDGAAMIVDTKKVWDKICSEIFNVPSNNVPVVDFSNKRIFVANWNCPDGNRFPYLSTTAWGAINFLLHTIKTEAWRPAALPLSVLIVTSIPLKLNPYMIVDKVCSLSVKDFDKELKQLENELEQLKKQGNQEEIDQVKERILLRKESVRLQLMGPQLNDLPIKL